ncbi:MAG TPA: GNAT family N-acetyltransferase [Candidatus Nanoarchaeia archaeon]|nr:GNAT family N-acetyltransferase [Candidatus Nanoarchaeia archaeon]
MIEQTTVNIGLVTDMEEIRRLYDFIRAQPFDYPRYLDWVEKCKRELELGIKRALVVKSQGIIVADLVFQAHKQERGVIEIKNVRVNPNYQRRGLFRQLVEQLEEQVMQEGYRRIVVDTHATNMPFITASQRLGFRRVAEEPLYSDQLEVILVKDL